MTSHDRFMELAAGEIDFELSADEASALHRHLAGLREFLPTADRTDPGRREVDRGAAAPPVGLERPGPGSRSACPSTDRRLASGSSP